MNSNSGTLMPRPEFAFRLGVTGTRKLSAAAVPVLTTQLDEVLEFLKSRLRNLAALAGSEIYAPRPACLRMLSPLAEGADRLVAARALALGYRLEAPLPFTADAYERDFPETIAEFRELLAQAGPRVVALSATRGSTDNESYEEAGRLVVRNCDLLIAIWDGGESRGRGGTAEIVSFAVQRGLPVWWLHAGGDADPAWLGNPLGLAQPQTCARGDAAFAELEIYLTQLILPPAMTAPALAVWYTNAMERAAPLPG